MNMEADSGIVTPGNVFGTGPSIAFGKISNKAPLSSNNASIGGFGSESGDFTVNGVSLLPNCKHSVLTGSCPKIHTQKEYSKSSYPSYPPAGMA